jgi:hypothetical protein
MKEKEKNPPQKIKKIKSFSGIANHDLLCVQFAGSAGKLLPGLLFRQIQLL